MNITCILAQISPTPVPFPADLAGRAAPDSEAAQGPSLAATLMEQANAMAGRSPAQAQALRGNAQALLSVSR